MLNIDNEDTNQLETEVNNNQAIYFSKNGESMLTWADQNYFFVIDTDAPELSMEELIEIAQSMEVEPL